MVGGRRIKLDLTDFVKDTGGQRWMFVNPEDLSTISDVVDRLREEHKQLGQQYIITLFLDNFILPSWESVELLQSGDLVKVCRTKVGCWRRLWKMIGCCGECGDGGVGGEGVVGEEVGAGGDGGGGDGGKRDRKTPIL